MDIDCICTDFQKAFDKVPHKRLIKKIENYGIANPILNWIEDFLSRRYQRVSIEGEISNRMEDTSGIPVPHGSVLDPMLFVFYINDLPDVVESEAYLFADDTNIFRLINSIDDQQILQNDLIKLENWSDKCLLKFHPEKCKHMNMHRTPKEEEVKYNLLGQQISKVKHEKDIGVLIDDELSFDKHICEMVSKANSIFAALRRTFRTLTADLFLPLCKTLVRTHLDYASSIWAPYKKKYIDQIESVQKRATKQIPGFHNLSYPERIKKLKLPTIAHRRIRGDMIETYKIINVKYDPEASSFLKLLSSSGNRFSRRNNNNKIVQQRFKTSLRKNSFAMRVAKVWNKLPDQVIHAASTNAFKNRLGNDHLT